MRVGAKNVFREYVTVHVATKDGEITVLGDGNVLLAYSHVAHDCVVGNGLVMSSHAAFGCRIFCGKFLASLLPVRIPPSGQRFANLAHFVRRLPNLWLGW